MESASLTVTVLGTGTSQGVPVIGCSCEVCQSTDPRDNRLRTSLLLSRGLEHLVVDAGPDFRQQMLRAQPGYVNGILLTHEHNDHVAGLDDVRAFNFMRMEDMPIYCHQRVGAQIKHRFAYAFAEHPYPGAPRFALQHIDKDQPFQIGSFYIVPIEFSHGNLPVLGFRIGDFTYLTDIKTISETELEKVRGTDTLIISALRRREHHSHLSLDEALALIRRIQPRKAYLTHLSHWMGKHADVEKELPPGVAIAYDDLQLTFL